MEADEAARRYLAPLRELSATVTARLAALDRRD